MSNRLKRAIGVSTLPKTVESDREAIRLLREEHAIVHFDCSEFDAYVKAPGGVIREFTVLHNRNCNHGGEEWEQTSIDPFTLKRELRRREFSIEADDSQTPFSDDGSDGV